MLAPPVRVFRDTCSLMGGILESNQPVIRPMEPPRPTRRVCSRFRTVWIVEVIEDKTIDAPVVFHHIQ